MFCVGAPQRREGAVMATNRIPISETMRNAFKQRDEPRPKTLCANCVYALRPWGVCDDLHAPLVRIADGRHLIIRCDGQMPVKP